MTRSVDIDFTFDDPLDVPATVHTLMRAGMKPTPEGELTYLIDEDGMFEWQRAPVCRRDEIISSMGGGHWKDRTVGITLLFPDGERGGDLLFHPGRRSLSYVIGVNPKPLPGSTKFCDMGWYLTQLVPLLEALGLSEVETRDSP
ncbi:hypothetical protein AB0K80_03390 [Streptomyces sp. NPDC052682]|uniref:hypothetical protein n=1 Tax=Streptomyces sp. NPDC052682 TaxID=3154954 RepID=UPI00342C028A